jgi:hypothetical protein
MRKLLISAIVILTLGIGFCIYMYFTSWREPVAIYHETKNPKLIRIRQELTELKAELKAKGLYRCCIRNECNWCALHMGHCHCADLVSKDGSEKSCPECAAAWNRKQGRVPGVDPKAVKVTTFGVYGYEKEGHHYHEHMNKEKSEHSEHEELEHHHEYEHEH